MNLELVKFDPQLISNKISHYGLQKFNSTQRNTWEIHEVKNPIYMMDCDKIKFYVHVIVSQKKNIKIKKNILVTSLVNYSNYFIYVESIEVVY